MIVILNIWKVQFVFLNIIKFQLLSHMTHLFPTLIVDGFDKFTLTIENFFIEYSKRPVNGTLSYDIFVSPQEPSPRLC